MQRHHFPLSYSLGSVFSDGKRTEHKKRTCSVKATAGSILHSGATIIQPAERYYPQQKSFYHHLETIQKAIRSEQYTEALSSLESLLLRPSRSNPASYCADSYINAVLQFKQEEAHRYGISVNYQILLPDLQLLKNFSASELSCILFNLLDNGIEACIQSEKATPEIHLQIHTEGTMLCIHMENTKTPARTFQKTTTKSAAIRHGFGLGIIETIV